MSIRYFIGFLYFLSFCGGSAGAGLQGKCCGLFFYAISKLISKKKELTALTLHQAFAPTPLSRFALPRCAQLAHYHYSLILLCKLGNLFTSFLFC
jgi:hypothetical protein